MQYSLCDLFPSYCHFTGTWQPLILHNLPENYQILSILKIALIIWFLLPGKLKNLCQQINLKHLYTPRSCSIVIKHSRNAIFWKDFQPSLTEFVLHVQFINAIVLYSSLREIIGSFFFFNINIKVFKRLDNFELICIKYLTYCFISIM